MAATATVTRGAARPLKEAGNNYTFQLVTGIRLLYPHQVPGLPRLRLWLLFPVISGDYFITHHADQHLDALAQAHQHVQLVSHLQRLFRRRPSTGDPCYRN